MYFKATDEYSMIFRHLSKIPLYKVFCFTATLFYTATLDTPSQIPGEIISRSIGLCLCMVNRMNNGENDIIKLSSQRNRSHATQTRVELRKTSIHMRN